MQVTTPLYALIAAAAFVAVPMQAHAEGGAGFDIVQVNGSNTAGDDFLEGGEGFDFVQVNGSNTAGDDTTEDGDDTKTDEDAAPKRRTTDR